MTCSETTATAFPAEMLEAVAGVLKVLGHRDRLAMVDVLSRKKFSVQELADRLGLASNAVSQHLGHLSVRGIVQGRREGRRVYYEVVHPVAKSLLRCMRTNMSAEGGG